MTAIEHPVVNSLSNNYQYRCLKLYLLVKFPGTVPLISMQMGNVFAHYLMEVYV
jgi:hypothetical protein